MPSKEVPKAVKVDLLCRKVRIWLTARHEGRCVEGEVERQGKEWCSFRDPIDRGHRYFNKTRFVDLWDNGEWVPLFTPTRKKKNPGSYGRNNGNARLTSEQVMEIRAMRLEGVLASEVGRLYGVDPGTIRNIKNGKAWAWVKDEGADNAE